MSVSALWYFYLLVGLLVLSLIRIDSNTVHSLLFYHQFYWLGQNIHILQLCVLVKCCLTHLQYMTPLRLRKHMNLLNAKFDLLEE